MRPLYLSSQLSEPQAVHWRALKQGDRTCAHATRSGGNSFLVKDVFIRRLQLFEAQTSAFAGAPRLFLLAIFLAESRSAKALGTLDALQAQDWRGT